MIRPTDQSDLGPGVSRIGGGAIWDVVSGPGDRLTEIRLQPCPAGWQATFELRDPAVEDLAIVHRLIAPSRREAREAVPRAIGFLLGYPLESSQ